MGVSILPIAILDDVVHVGGFAVHIAIEALVEELQAVVGCT